MAYWQRNGTPNPAELQAQLALLVRAVGLTAPHGEPFYVYISS